MTTAQGTAASLPGRSGKQRVHSGDDRRKEATGNEKQPIRRKTSALAPREGALKPNGVPATLRLTRLLVSVPATRLPESHQGPEVGSQDGPAEGRHRVDAHQAANEGVLAALEQGHDVGPHVVSVLLSEVLSDRRVMSQRKLEQTRHTKKAAVVLYCSNFQGKIDCILF